MHSTGIIFSFLHSMARPWKRGARKNSGSAALSVVIMWLAMMSRVKSNQKRLICVSTAPLPRTSFLRIMSKTLMRSVATITRFSPRS